MGKPPTKYQASSRVGCLLSCSVRVRPTDSLAKLCAVESEKPGIKSLLCHFLAVWL